MGRRGKPALVVAGPVLVLEQQLRRERACLRRHLFDRVTDLMDRLDISRKRARQRVSHERQYLVWSNRVRRAEEALAAARYTQDLKEI